MPSAGSSDDRWPTWWRRWAEAGGPGRRVARSGTSRGRRAEEAEHLAATELRRRGLQVLDRNWRSGRREIDLVVREGEVVAFVEVKGRGEGPQDPLEAISPAQKRRLSRAAAAWIGAHPGVGREFRFDAVAVRFPADGGRPRVRHVRDAWVADP